MADAHTTREDAGRLAGRIREDPDQVDPAVAAGTGIGLLHELDAGTDLEPLHLATGLIGFAVRAAPDHPSASEWWGELGFAHGWIAEETGSVPEFEKAIACTLTATSAPAAPPEIAEHAAVETAYLTGALLRSEAVTAERARQLIEAVEGIPLSWAQEVDATRFDFARAWALRWAYPLTEDSGDLRRAVDILRRALATPKPPEVEQDCIGERELLAMLLRQLYLDSGDHALLEEALAAAEKVRALLPANHEGLPDAHGVVAELAEEIFWNTDGEASAVLETAVTAYAAKRTALGLDDDETVSYAVLLQVRGCTAEDVPALTAAVEVLETPERAPGAEVVLAGLHELLVGHVGPRHAWPAIDWATRALARPDPGPEVVLPLHGCRIAGLEVALKAFGGNEVAARYDVDTIVAEALAEAKAGEDAARAELELQIAQFRGLWTADRFPLDVNLLQATSVEMADAVHRMRGHADADAQPKLDNVATLLEDMVPVLMGDRDPKPLHTALQDVSLQGMDDADGLLKWLDQLTELQAMVDNGQPVAARLQELVADTAALAPEMETSAIVPFMGAIAETAGLVENGDATARSAGYRKVIRMCDELPEHLASSPFVRRIRGSLAAQLTVGGHDGQLGDQAESAIDDLERALERSGTSWDTIQLTEQLGQLLRRRAGPGDVARSRQLARDVLTEHTWHTLVRSHREDDRTALRFTRLASDWCREDGALDDLVRIVEAERGAALARGAGTELVRSHLVGTGRAGLAEEWVTASSTGDVWDQRRLDLHSRLSDEDKRSLARPWGPEEIRLALNESGLDALGYLVPRQPTLGGTLVVVPARGPVSCRRLPLLSGQWFASAAADAVGGWAWLAAGAAVLAAAEAARPPGPAGVPRVALVPVGLAGRVPWAAAWRETESGRRYLVEDVEITGVPSARLLAPARAADGEPVFLPGDADHLSRSDYDEALEPSSALLVEGTRTVVRAVWPTADDSVLFPLFRHFLRMAPTNPAGALRRAQLWMLDPARLPQPGLSVSHLENPADITNWGGFACLGR
ncbi:CHAT domain-containing protein [Amycolatopsis sp. A133]|uniref:CHAT domain-containing protein n=1 Tax=Amycolatopsis sp. A133 TaxID=3064472 RepID=UPI0027FA985D|nr:CHAT domain-containing protein [Amycolatopsis sp. A133]MDQ7803289.1 CHAT domain-containing protein [Amycolatopsis sp. A133]